MPLTVVAVFQYFLIGTMPIGEWHPMGVQIPLSAVGVLSMMVLYGFVLARPQAGGVATKGGETSGRERELAG